MNVRDLLDAGAPEPLVDEWSKTIVDLTPVQERAVRAGVFTGTSNLLVVAPTTSGKTFVGEMAAASTAYRTRRHALFLVPFRALADEHFELFRQRYGDLLSVVISTSDWGQFDADIRAGNFGVGVLTYEKLTGLLVSHPQVLSDASVLVVDELQMLRDPGRGPGLELMLTQVMLASQRPQLVALSASLDDLNSVDRWLDAEVVHENERPVPLDEGVVSRASGRSIVRVDGDLQQQGLFAAGGTAEKEDSIGVLCASLVEDGKQVLVFRTSATRARPTAQAVARRLQAAGLPTATAALLDGLESSETLEDQRRFLASGVGFHTADLPTGERRAVEQSFRSGDTRVIVSSGTLAMGVNLPTDVVLVCDTVRFIPNRWEWNREPLSVADYKNQVGRAGRLGKRARGLGLLLVDQDFEQRQLFDLYCNGAVEPIESRLPEAPFDDVVFRVLAADLASSEDELVEFLASTFAFLTFWQHYGGVQEVRGGVARALDSCLESGLVRREDDRLYITRSGRFFAGHGIPLGVATRLSELVEDLRADELPLAEIVHRIAACDALFERRPYTDWDRQTRRLRDPRDDLRIDSASLTAGHQLHDALGSAPSNDREARVLMRTGCLLEWIEGAPEQELGRRYPGCAHARLRAMGQTAAWLTDAAAGVGTIRGADEDRVARLRRLVLELRYGLPQELAGLARVNAQGVGRASLMRLYEGDTGLELYDPDNLLEASADDLAGLLTPIEAVALREAITAERGESLRRRRRGHRERAERAQFNAQLIDDLYTATGGGLEQAVTDALSAVGLRVTRIVRQPYGEEDIQLDHQSGTVVISVTASDSETKAISWNKAREVLGTGAGLNPVNYICVGRPSFHSLAERRALEIASEVGQRRLLLVPIPVIADAVLRCQEGHLTAEELGDLLAGERGLLDFVALETAAEAGDSAD
jgi:helicase